MSEKPFDICERTFNFSQRIVKLCSFLNQKGYESRDISRQLIRSGTSIGANVEESQAASPFGEFKIRALEIQNQYF